MLIKDVNTGVLLGDPEKNPFAGAPLCDRGSLEQAFGQLILSASGWRKVFCYDGNEESFSPDVSDADLEIAATIADAYSVFIRQATGKKDGCIVVGVDTRPTGPTLADTMIRVLIARGFSIRYLFISAAPEVMAYVRSVDEVDGFVYISASHNPVGHNGAKFGLNDGGVLRPRQAEQLIAVFKELLFADDHSRCIRECTGNVEPGKVESVFQSVSKWKKDALAWYTRFLTRVICGEDSQEKQDSFMMKMREGTKKYPLGIVAELNGSARACSIDETFLTAGGFRVSVVHGTPGNIVHPILPEGDSLNPCREELEIHYREDSSFVLGYVPDNDGDRGNLVILDPATGKGTIPPAQEIFALAVTAELATLVYTGALTYDGAGRPGQRVAVAVNGPTSMRIDEIAHAFGARVFRAEVGEANVVNLARDLRKDGYIVRILGEGSNGGNITHPSSVRDPMGTVFAAAKLLTLRSDGEKKGLFRIWCDRIGADAPDETAISLNDIIASLPVYATTGANEQRAILNVGTKDQAVLKRRYEERFPEEWEKQKDYLFNRLGIAGWKEINYEGTAGKEGIGSRFRTGKENGGLKILFHDNSGQNQAFIWMRGSKTEPVFRILADVKGDHSDAEHYLLEWQTRMIQAADQ